MWSETRLNSELTIATYGYDPLQLSSGSHQKVIVECLNCHAIINRAFRNLNSKHECPVVIGDKKRCFKCGEWKDLSLFNKNPKLSGAVSKTCRECHNKYDSVSKCEARRKQRQKFGNDLDYYLYHRAHSMSSRARRRGVPYDVSPIYLLSLWNEQNGLCYYTGLPMKNSMKQYCFQAWDAPSLDRKEPSLGYIIGNVVWCIFAVNSFKSSLNEQQFKEMIASINWNPWIVENLNRFSSVIVESSSDR